MKYEIKKDEFGDIISCDSCNSEVATSEFPDRRGMPNISDIFSTNKVLYTDNNIGIVALIKQRLKEK